MPHPNHAEIERSRAKAIRERRYLVIPADATDEELEIYAAILNGELPFSAQPRGASADAGPGSDDADTATPPDER